MTTKSNHTRTSARRATPGFGMAVLGAAMALAMSASAVVAADGEAADPAGDYAVLVRAELFTDDLAEAQPIHDAVASGGEEAARAAGDVYHLAAISTSLLGNSEGSFLGVDLWDAPDNIEAFYSDPAFAEGFSALFGSEPTIELFEHRPDWYQWGAMPDSNTEEDLWITVVRGQLAEADPTAAQAAHDAVASGGQERSMAAGDISHTVFTGVEDASEFLAFDVWTSDENIEATLGDPEFQAAFAPLFASPPSVVVYRSTDWHQW